MDLRETTVSDRSLDDLLKLALEFVQYKFAFRNKIANVIPDKKDRFRIAQQFKACLDIKGFEYEVFRNFEDAIEWLSDVSHVGFDKG